jgi:hypothetical protein
MLLLSDAFLRCVSFLLELLKSLKDKIMNKLLTPSPIVKTAMLRLALAWIGLIALAAPAAAQAPGQDTIVIKQAPQQSSGGGAPERKGTGLDERTEMSPGLKAKIARYTAVANNKADAQISLLSLDQRVESAGFSKTCVQDVGSTPAPSTGRYGPRNQDQIVVMRGDLVNICR